MTVKRPSRRWILVAAVSIGLGVVSVLAGNALFGRLFGRSLFSAAPGSTALVRLTIAGERLAIPANLIRFTDQRANGAKPRIDLHLIWPELEGFTPANAQAFDDLGPTSRLIFVAIQPREAELDSSGRLATIYARFFEGPPWDTEPGLRGQKMAKGSGYDGEDVFFEPGAVHPFVARCFSAGDREGSEICMRELNVGKALVLTFRFRKATLADWRLLDAAMLKLFAGFSTEAAP